MDDSRLRFLGDGIRRVRDARVTVVGAGGTGSHIVQQLAHLGLQAIILIDPDTLDPSNINRVVLSHAGFVGKPKTLIPTKRLRKLNTDIVPISESLESADAIAALQSSDLCFGAVDHFGTRHLIEYFARMALVPVIDVGTQIVPSFDKGARKTGATSAGGQVVTSIPGEACFWCMGFLSDGLLTRERTRYADGDAQFEQQVISMNGILASQAVTNMLALFAGFVGPAGLTRYISYNALTQQMGAHPNLIGLNVDDCTHYDVISAGWAAR